MAQASVLQQQLTELDGKIDTMVELSGQNKHLANQEGIELEDQVHMISDQNRSFDAAQENVDGAIDDEHKLLDMGKGNCAGWILSILMLVAIVLVWVIPKPK
jgi:hypothetical protein